jgi:predicted ATP-binding protein involved in virulence
LTKWITFFDYLRDSKVVGERKLGKIVFKALEKAVSLSITGGHRLRVSRTTLEPIISVGDRDFTLEKLSAGNIFILQHIVSLIYKAYCVIVLSEKFMDDGPLNIFDVPGLLLIDEPENHLHPKWQKVLLKSINTAFPNVQIIATTHSPFIISSIENSNIYVCKATETGSLVDDETDNYTNKPIDEILTTDLFNTLPFNQKITNLIAEKKTAIESGDNQLAEEIEKKLIKINPQYFSFLNLHDTIGDLLKSQDESDH